MIKKFTYSKLFVKVLIVYLLVLFQFDWFDTAKARDYSLSKAVVNYVINNNGR